MIINFSTAAQRKFHAPHNISRCSWFPVFDWRGEPVFHKHVKWSYPSPIGRWEVLCTFCLSWMYRERPDSKEGQISLQSLKFRLVFHVTRWRDVWIPCGDPRESRRSPPHLDRGESHHFDTWRGTRNSLLQKVTMPYSSWEWIGIPISLFQLESEPRSPASPPDASVLSC